MQTPTLIPLCTRKCPTEGHVPATTDTNAACVTYGLVSPVSLGG